MTNNRTTQVDGRWLSFHRSSPSAAIRLFCFPHAGGGASSYYGWQDNLPAEIEVIPIQLPGREERTNEPPVHDLSLMVDSVSNALSPLLNKPFALLGHSMGALLAYEVAQHLCSTFQKEPSALVVSGMNAPQTVDRAEGFVTLSDEELITELQELNGTPEEVLRDRELLDLVLPILRADHEACRRYLFKQAHSLSCPIIACNGLRDRMIDRQKIEAWRSLTSGRFTMRMFNGDHFYIHTQRHLLMRMLTLDLLSLV